ncbi:hypothetical protein Tco_1522905 [Tanacetum coccineum]
MWFVHPAVCDTEVCVTEVCDTEIKYFMMSLLQEGETLSSQSVKESSLVYETSDVHAIQNKMPKAKERCMSYFRSLYSHLRVLLNEDLKGTRTEHGFKRAFILPFGQDVETFTSTIFLYVDQLEKQLDKDEFQEDDSMDAFWVLNRHCQQFIYSQFSLDYDNQMTNKSFSEYTRIKAKDFRDTLLKHMSFVKKSIDKRENADLVVTYSNGTESEKHDTSSRSENDTHAEDAYIKLVNDKQPMAKAQITAEYNVLANRQQHAEQPEFNNEGRGTRMLNNIKLKQVENGVVELYFVNTEYQLADIFTKVLGRERIKFLINKLGMQSFTPETLKQLADEAEE